ncbi:MAG TPA: sigma-70 family RNA polymerase sigma factor [Gemmatimonadales bacterium]|nr:sigma-70 family RNA polymerase sigma factor [Gemmatimonadales bacterium]
MPDADLVRRVLAGDVEAFGVLVARYRPRCARFATHMLGSREDAEEAVQEAFIRAYRALHRCDPERFGAWLFRILANRCRTHRGRRVRRDRLVVADEAAMLGASTRPTTDRAAWREEIARALAQLPADQREAFLLKHVEELSYEEMVERTGAGISALKMRVKRACDRLKIMLSGVIEQ